MTRACRGGRQPETGSHKPIANGQRLPPSGGEYTSSMPTLADAPTPRGSRQAAVRIIRELRGAGYTAYLAGGCVRDRLLGHDPEDHDVATDARPEEVRRVWRSSRYVGEAFGVVLARVGEVRVEVATFRRESGYDDHRRPTRVEFTDAREDALRRDFTINGLFEDPVPDPAGDTPREAKTRRLEEGSVVIDFVDGLRDLEAGVIRAIGDPAERFEEDYLRMLRAVRFAARLGFKLDDATARAIGPLARHLGSISRERIGDETRRMLTGARPAAAAVLCQRLRLDGPTLNEDHAEPDLATLRALEETRGHAPLPVALAAWMVDRHTTGRDVSRLAAFADHGSTRVIRRWRDALCLSNAERDDLGRLFRAIPEALRWGELPKAKRKRLLAAPGYPLARALLHVAGGAAIAEQIDRDAAPLIDEGLTPAPFITGEDLIALGHQPGPDFKALLESVYDAQLAGDVTNREQALETLREQAGSPHH